MTSEKHRNLLTYVDSLKNRLNSPDVPAKHRDSKEAYHEFLKLELRRTMLRLETDLVVESKSK